MKLITWNVQWCRGLDGRVDPQRIVEHAQRLADFDVLGLQEVAANFDDLPGSGKPIPGLGRRQDPNWWLKDYLKREKLEPPLPELAALRKEIERLPETLATERSE
ncbi:MAG: DUF1992 domain-containing protein, partial [Pseudomonadota bacterium]